MSESKVQLIMPTSEDMKKLGIKKEIESQGPTIHKEADENYYQSAVGPTLGKAIHAIVAGRNRERVKAFENKEFQLFFKHIFQFVEKRAHEMGYFTEDVEFSTDSGITRDGTLLLKLVPKLNARRLL